MSDSKVLESMKKRLNDCLDGVVDYNHLLVDLGELKDICISNETFYNLYTFFGDLTDEITNSQLQELFNLNTELAHSGFWLKVAHLTLRENNDLSRLIYSLSLLQTSPMMKDDILSYGKYMFISSLQSVTSRIDPEAETIEKVIEITECNRNTLRAESERLKNQIKELDSMTYYYAYDDSNEAESIFAGQSPTLWVSKNKDIHEELLKNIHQLVEVENEEKAQKLEIRFFRVIDIPNDRLPEWIKNTKEFWDRFPDGKYRAIVHNDFNEIKENWSKYSDF